MDSFQSISGDAENSSVTRRGVSRRSVMKAGAAAAWSVPLVQVVAAAPAVAASGAAALSITGASGSWTGKSANMKTQVTINNTGNAATSSLQVTFDFDSPWTGGSATAPTGWTPGASSATSFTFVAGTQLAAGASTTIDPSFASSGGKGFAVSISVSPTGTGASSVAGVIAVEAKQ